MKKYYLLLLTICFQISVAFANHPLKSKIKEATTDYISSRFLNAVFMFSDEHNTLEIGAKGIHSIYGRQLKATQKMPIASVTKTMTAAGILRLQEKGLLNVNAGLAKYLTKESGVWRQGRMPAWANKIKLHHLLTHTSGLPEYFKAMKINLDQPVEEIAKDIASFAAGKNLSFVPGTKYEYNNTNYMLLGLVIERVSGKSLAQFYQEEFFEPLGMKSTKLASLEEAIKFQEEPEKTEYPVRYFVTPNGGKPEFNQAKADYIMVPFSDGGVVSNTGDLIRWYKALHGGKVLKPESYKLMTRKHYPGGSKFGKKDYTGYGMFISEMDNGDVVYHHEGSALAIRCESGYIPSRHLFYAIISNVMNYIPQHMEGKIDLNLPQNQLDIRYFRQAIFDAIL